VTAQHWAELFVIVLCFILAALASGTETALTSWPPGVATSPRGEPLCAHLQRLQRDPNRFLLHRAADSTPWR